MKRIICDHCKTEQPEQTNGLGPAGWYRVYHNGGTDERTGKVYRYNDARDFCSPACVMLTMGTDIRNEQPPIAAAVDVDDQPADDTSSRDEQDQPF
ncbi:MAG TPA: hypothetical protein VFO16_14075 [Pseudonocardiaceae bacterium]|nr:hypothetical protein [Pseudonocardiaceae bacterium]